MSSDENWKRVLNELDYEGLQPDRLQTCITVMERVRDNGYAFNMNVWVAVPRWGDDVEILESELHQCGAAACFAGWLASSVEWLEVPGCGSYSLGEPAIRRDHELFYGHEAINVFLGIRHQSDVGSYLVDPGLALYAGLTGPGAIKPQHVIDRLIYIQQINFGGDHERQQ